MSDLRGFSLQYPWMMIASRLLWQASVALLAVFLLATLPSPPLHAQAGCPPFSEAFGEVIEGTTKVVRCRCIKWMTNYNGNCRPLPEVEQRLLDRARDAAAGAKSSAESALFELGILGGQRLQSHAGPIIGTAAVVIASRSAKAGHAAVLALLADVAVFLANSGGCEANENTRIACGNMRNFNRILEETKVELEKVLKRYEESAQ